MDNKRYKQVDLSKLPFKVGSKVLAKVKGYDPWPAIVRGIIDDAPNRILFHVYFYATKDTANCKQDDLYDYVKYRDKFRKRSKKKLFQQAFDELEEDLELSLRKPLLFVKNHEKRGNKRKSSVQEFNEKQRKGSSSGKDGGTSSKYKNKSQWKKFSNEQCDSDSSLMDEDDELDCAMSDDSSSSDEDNIDLRLAPEEFVGCDGWVPPWKSSKNMKKLRSTIEKIKERSVLIRPEHIDGSSTEVLVLNSFYHIHTSVQLTGLDYETCIRAMDTILDSNLTELILKKYPRLVNTVVRLRGYIGNVEQWKLPVKELKLFEERAETIRSKATEIYLKIQRLFPPRPNGVSFLELFNNEVKMFRHNEAKHLPAREVCVLQKDKRSKERKHKRKRKHEKDKLKRKEKKHCNRDDEDALQNSGYLSQEIEDISQELEDVSQELEDSSQ